MPLDTVPTSTYEVIAPLRVQIFQKEMYSSFLSTGKDNMLEFYSGAIEYTVVYLKLTKLLYSAPECIQFHALATEWKAQSAALSSTSKAVMLPAYQSIIGMGRPAIPLLLRQLQSEGGDPGAWFWALKVITREDPVPPESRGNRAAMAKAWIEWGKARYAS